MRALDYETPQRAQAAGRVQAVSAGTKVPLVEFDLQALVDHHDRCSDRFTTDVQQGVMAKDNGGLAPPAEGRSGAPVAELRECKIADLTLSLGRHATGRILYGTLCTRPTCMTSVMTVCRGPWTRVSLGHPFLV
jgi:hypothetical protein